MVTYLLHLGPFLTKTSDGWHSYLPKGAAKQIWVVFGIRGSKCITYGNAILILDWLPH